MTETESLIRQFDSGAVRGSLDGKLSYKGFLSPSVLRSYAEYMQRHRVQADGNIREPDNWKKGIPKDSYVDSLLRHTIDFWAAYEAGNLSLTDELGKAIFFNIHGYLHERERDKSW